MIERVEKEDRREIGKAWLRISEILAAAWIAAPVGAFFLGKGISAGTLVLEAAIGFIGTLTCMFIAARIFKGRWIS